MRYGHFDTANREYVVDRPDTPVSWTNYLGFNKFCSVISNNAGGYNFLEDSARHRLLRFRFNSLPMDRPGRYVYLRDDDTGDYWSIPWQPVGKDLKKFKSECCHGAGYTRIKSVYSGIEAEVLYFVPLDDPVEIWDVKIKNISGRKRNLSIFTYAEFSFWKFDQEPNLQYILYVARPSYKNGTIGYHVRFSPIDQRFGFFLTSAKVESFDTNRDKFIGPYRSESNPAAIENGICSDSVIPGGNVCGSLHSKIPLKNNESTSVVYVSGTGDAQTFAPAMKKRYASAKTSAAEFARLKAFWEGRFNTFQCDTPDEGMNAMLNTWNQIQCQINFKWSRFATFIEVGGRDGLGFRDSSQDTMAVNHSAAPAETRSRLAELLQGQLSSGAALHSIHPKLLRPGHEKHPPIENLCSDDHLWIVLAVADYIKETNDRAFFNAVLPYADRDSSTVYEHIRRAVDFSIKYTGEHGICRSLAADWNDCIGLGGKKGESVWTSMFLYKALDEFIGMAAVCKATADVKRYSRLKTKVKEAVERVAWDGEWYVRGFRENDGVVGSRKNKAAKIYLEPNSWAVLSGLASGERARKSLESIHKHLNTKHGILLLTPSEQKLNAFPAGMKENGAIFCHPNPWAMVAECLAGNGDRAFEYYSTLNPYNANDSIEVHDAEPYVYCQSIIGKEHPDFGKARHPWGTGTAAWAFIAGAQYMLGFRPDYDGFVIDPCIPKKWDGFKLRREFRKAIYNIVVENPNHVSKGVQEIWVNGKKIETGLIKPCKAGTQNTIRVVMG